MMRVVLGLAQFVFAAPAFALTVEVDTARFGATYTRFEPIDVSACAQACAGDPRCLAWTVVAAGLQGPRAICELKAAPAPASASPCCVSGLKGAGLPPRPPLDVQPAPVATALVRADRSPDLLEAASALAAAPPAGATSPTRQAAPAGRPKASPPRSSARPMATAVRRPDPADSLAGGPG
jgi:hypothetical protein